MLVLGLVEMTLGMCEGREEPTSLFACGKELPKM